MSQKPNYDRGMLYDLMQRTLDESDLKELCFVLEVDFGDVPGESKKEKIQEFIRFFEKHDRLGELIEKLNNIRPNIKWTEVLFTDKREVLESDEEESERRDQLSPDELIKIIYDLESALTQTRTVMGSVVSNFSYYLLEALASPSYSTDYPNIQGLWRGTVNLQNKVPSIVRIYQNGSHITLNGSSDENKLYGFVGDGRLISDLLIFRWRMNDKTNGLNIMTVQKDATVIDGKFINQTSGSGPEIYERISENPLDEHVK